MGLHPRQPEGAVPVWMETPFCATFLTKIMEFVSRPVCSMFLVLVSAAAPRPADGRALPTAAPGSQSHPLSLDMLFQPCILTHH